MRAHISCDDEARVMGIIVRGACSRTELLRGVGEDAARRYPR
jgi:hypothetical protein